MGKKTAKATKKFITSGKLRKTIQARHKHQKVRKTIEGRRGAHRSKGETQPVVKAGSDATEDEDEEVNQSKGKDVKGKGRMTVDDFLGAGFMDQDSDGEGAEGVDNGSSDEDSDGEEGSVADDASFGSVDDLDDEGETHLVELTKLAEKDPEFFKYLQENDKELLDFDPDALPDVADDDNEEENGEDEDVEMEEKVPVLTKQILQKWQKALLEQRSLRALRKLLIAFRSAVYMNEEGHMAAWTIDSPSVYTKLIVTTLRYTPVVLGHHAPIKTLPNGKFKSPTQTTKLKSLQKMILSYFHNIVNLITQLSDTEMLELALNESSKIIPYVLSSRKAVKAYLKKCLELWSSAADSIRVAAYVAIRKLASSSNETILDQVLKGSYLTLIRSSKSISPHTLPAINLMKNSASEVFCLDHATTYQHAFGYIRQLAIHLRNSTKSKTKEAYKLVYNWQYVHCIDFWSIVLSRACDTRAAGSKDSDLKPLIYPLVQVSLGSIKLISNSRSFPFHLQVVRSLLHLTRHTNTYIPISPYLLPVLTTTLANPRPKASTLRPLDLDMHIRAPQQYAKTRIYNECLVEEACFLLTEWLCSSSVHGSIAFPEVVVPITILLRKNVKATKSRSNSGKEISVVKNLVERVEESAAWLDNKRKDVDFAPSKLNDVHQWESQIQSRLDESPLGKYLKVQQKAREKRQKLVEKAQKGEHEILEE